jgi:hypothetical protein
MNANPGDVSLILTYVVGFLAFVRSTGFAVSPCARGHRPIKPHSLFMVSTLEYMYVHVPGAVLLRFVVGSRF